MIVNGQAFAYHGQMESAHTRILFWSFRSHKIWIKVIRVLFSRNRYESTLLCSQRRIFSDEEKAIEKEYRITSNPILQFRQNPHKIVKKIDKTIRSPAAPASSRFPFESFHLCFRNCKLLADQGSHYCPSQTPACRYNTALDHVPDMSMSTCRVRMYQYRLG